MEVSTMPYDDDCDEDFACPDRDGDDDCDADDDLAPSRVYLL